MGKDYSFTLREVSKRPVARSDHVLALRIFLIIICFDIVSALSIERLPAVRVSELKLDLVDLVISFSLYFPSQTLVFECSMSNVVCILRDI